MLIYDIGLIKESSRRTREVYYYLSDASKKSLRNDNDNILTSEKYKNFRKGTDNILKRNNVEFFKVPDEIVRHPLMSQYPEMRKAFFTPFTSGGTAHINNTTMRQILLNSNFYNQLQNEFINATTIKDKMKYADLLSKINNFAESYRNKGSAIVGISHNANPNRVVSRMIAGSPELTEAWQKLNTVEKKQVIEEMIRHEGYEGLANKKVNSVVGKRLYLTQDKPENHLDQDNVNIQGAKIYRNDMRIGVHKSPEVLLREARDARLMSNPAGDFLQKYRDLTGENILTGSFMGEHDGRNGAYRKAYNTATDAVKKGLTLSPSTNSIKQYQTQFDLTKIKNTEQFVPHL